MLINAKRTQVFTLLHGPNFHSGQVPRLQLVLASGSILASHLPLPPLHSTERSFIPVPQDTEHCDIWKKFWIYRGKKSEIAFVALALLRSLVGLETLYRLPNQSDTELKPMVTCLPAISLARARLHVFTLDCHRQLSANEPLLVYWFWF